MFRSVKDGDIYLPLDPKIMIRCNETQAVSPMISEKETLHIAMPSTLDTTISNLSEEALWKEKLWLEDAILARIQVRA
jgi:hypothetical protein